MSPRVAARVAGAVTGAVLAAAGLTACGGPDRSGPVTLRLGYFPNLTHATAIVGVQTGIFARELAPVATLQTTTFNAGPAAIEALFSGAIDATFVGPNPAINAWARSRGQAVRVVAGAASGGVFFVTRPSITTVADLRGTTIATPQLGNTQDVALRYWLKQNGYRTTPEGGGDVSIKPQDNAVTVEAFAAGAIDGAWVPEPTAARLVALGGRVFLDERDLWPSGQFVITHLLVSTRFLAAHRDVVKRLVAGAVAANASINADPTGAQRLVEDGIGRLTGKPLNPTVTAQAWRSLEFLDDPLADTLRVGAEHAREVGLLEPVDLTGIYDLSLLNEVLQGRGIPEVLS